MSLNKASHMAAGVVLMTIGVSDWRGAVGVLLVVMCHCCMYMYTFSLSLMKILMYIYNVSLTHSCLYVYK